jgi:hypothetical protein
LNGSINSKQMIDPSATKEGEWSRRRPGLRVTSKIGVSCVHEFAVSTKAIVAERFLAEQNFLSRFRREIRLLGDAPAGTRFTRRHKRMLARKRSIWVRIGRVLASGLVGAAGVAMLALPGPGLLVIVLALAMLGGEFAWVARLMDRAELWLRERWLDARRFWSRAGWVLRVTLIVIAVAVVIATGLGAWHLFFA